MDISQFDSIKTQVSELQVEGPDDELLTYDTGEKDDEGKPLHKIVTISLVSSDSSEYTREYKAQVTETISKVAKRAGKGGKFKVTGDSVDADKLELAIACTKGWVGFESNGKDLEFNPKNCRMLYTRLPFVREQVEQYLNDRGNFLTSGS